MKNDLTEIRDRLDRLEKAVFAANLGDGPVTADAATLDFSLNERAFIKKYSAGFNGQEFFTLITAYVSQGQEGVSVALQDIKTTWQRCAGMIGVPYASIFATRAKENSWVDSARGTKGSYALGKHWCDIQKAP